MSLLTRPSVVFAIVFGCFAILLPRIFLPLLRSKPAAPSQNFDDNFRRPPPPITRNEHSDTVQHIPGSPPHMRGAHPGMRMHHPGGNTRQEPTERTGSRSIVTLALPMYSVGIAVFFIYTCCKYWGRKDTDDNKMKKHFGNEDLLWDTDKRKVKYDILDKDSEEEQENKDDFYAGLDPDYIEYLKTKKEKALEAERVMTDEQKQMHHALEEMKKSLSFISSKLVNKDSRGNINGNEILQLQERLATTEAQMCKILTALDTASDKVNQMTKKSSKTKEEAPIASKVSNEDESSSSTDEENVPNHVEEEEDYDEDDDQRSESISSVTHRMRKINQHQSTNKII